MVTESGRPELDDITLEIQGISDHPRGKVVTVQSTHPTVLGIGLMRSFAGLRARGRALLAVGVIDTTLKKISGADIQSFTHVEGSPKTIEREDMMETLEYDVVVKDEAM